MRASKPISTISYNSEAFLRNKIQEWKKLGLIEYGMWIKHLPDEDDKKVHYHVYLKPAKLIQTMDLEKDSYEYQAIFPYENTDPNTTALVKTNPKPLKMIGFRMSKEGDWVLYGVHDKAYLAEKGMTRKYHYSFSDIETTCEDTLKDIITHLLDDRKGRLENRIYDCILKGLTWREIVCTGIVPLRQIGNAHMFYKAVTGQIPDYVESRPPEPVPDVVIEE